MGFDIPTVLFYCFATALTASAVMVISSKNPVHSVLFLIFCFFNAAGLFVLLGAEYIAMTLVIVYVGAVAVLFLFVVMMLDIHFIAWRQGFVQSLPLGIGIALLFFLELAALFLSSGETAPAAPVHAAPADVTNTDSIGRILYTDYMYAFQISGIILLVAMIGAIVLTLRSRSGVRKQRISRQVQRRREDSVMLANVKPGEGV